MMKKALSLALSALLIHTLSYGSLGSTNPTEAAKKAMLAAQVRAGVMHLGTGKSSVVRVVLYDKTKYHGYITEIGEEGFVVADAKTGASAPIDYPEVKGIKGNNFSTNAKIGIGLAIAAAIAIIIAVVASGGNDNEAPFDPRCGGIRAPCP